MALRELPSAAKYAFLGTDLILRHLSEFTDDPRALVYDHLIGETLRLAITTLDRDETVFLVERALSATCFSAASLPTSCALTSGISIPITSGCGECHDSRCAT